MSTIETHHHGHASTLVAALAVVGIVGAAALGGVAWDAYHDGHAVPAGSHLVLPDYPPPIPPGGPAIHHAQSESELPVWPTHNGRRIQLGQ